MTRKYFIFLSFSSRVILIIWNNVIIASYAANILYFMVTEWGYNTTYSFHHILISSINLFYSESFNLITLTLAKIIHLCWHKTITHKESGKHRKYKFKIYTHLSNEGTNCLPFLTPLMWQELGYLSQYNVWQRIFPLTSVSRPTARPTLSPIQWVLEVNSRDIARPGREADQSPHLVPR
jgi:hypothetical protein